MRLINVPVPFFALVIRPSKPGRGDGSGEGEEGDQLEGRYATPGAAPLTVEVKEGNNDPFRLLVQKQPKLGRGPSR